MHRVSVWLLGAFYFWFGWWVRYYNLLITAIRRSISSSKLDSLNKKLLLEVGDSLVAVLSRRTGKTSEPCKRAVSISFFTW